MGTHSTTHIYDGMISTENHLVSCYKQYDGSISAYGADLSNFLNKLKLVNGYNSNQKNGEFANGMDCLSAQLIKHFKDGIGGYYITKADDTQEYDYYVYSIDETIYIKVISYTTELFNGTVLEFSQYIIDNSSE